MYEGLKFDPQIEEKKEHVENIQLYGFEMACRNICNYLNDPQKRCLYQLTSYDR